MAEAQAGCGLRWVELQQVGCEEAFQCDGWNRPCPPPASAQHEAVHSV